MLKKKISQLDSANASLSGYIPMSDAAGTVTNKVTVQSILDLGGGGSGLTWSSVPASPTASGTAGQIAYDGDYFYVATATNAWERVALSSWDQIFSTVVSLLHADPPYTAQAFPDATGRVWTAVGSPTISTSIKKFGSSIAFPNSPLSYLSTPRTSDLEIGTADFTLEWWLYPTAYPAGSAGQYNSSIYGTRGDNGAAAGFIAVVNPSGRLALFMDGGAQNWGLFGGTTLTTSSIPLNTWTHVAITRSGSTWKGWFNGQLEETVTQSGTPSVGNGNITVGGDPSGERFVGYIDDFRFTKGIRYQSNFTPPLSAHPKQ